MNLRSQVCNRCGKKGSHLEDQCGKKHPELKPKLPTPRKKKDEKKVRKERRSRSRDKSVEKEDKRTRNNSPYPEGRVGRVSRDEFTDKDSDDSDKDNVRELERDYLAAKEKS